MHRLTTAEEPTGPSLEMMGDYDRRLLYMNCIATTVMKFPIMIMLLHFTREPTIVARPIEHFTIMNMSFHCYCMLTLVFSFIASWIRFAFLDEGDNRDRDTVQAEKAGYFDKIF